MGAQRVFLAGATGAVGLCVLRLLHARGHYIRTLSRSRANVSRLGSLTSDAILADATTKGALSGALEGIDVVVSCLGANVSLSLHERRGFGEVDLVSHWALIEEAKRAKTKRFVYLSAYAAPGYASTRYIRAHTLVEEAIQQSGIPYTFVRPTGIFTALSDLMTMARRGLGMVIGDGQAKTNPVHPLDVADVIAQVTLEGPEAISVGGPEIMTREDMMRRAFEATGKKLRILHIPPALFRVMAWPLRLLHPRLADMLEFASAVTTTDSVGPLVGTRKLAPWFEDLARTGR